MGDGDPAGPLRVDRVAFFLRKTGIDSPEIEILPLSSH
jgi:hypothetical protein